ncbi:hypothetical protein CCP3SC15_1280001 [Gammaproteobacteria bacterium]
MRAVTDKSGRPPLPLPLLNPARVQQDFSDAIVAAGLERPEVIIPDGKLRRFSSNGKRGDDAGWYVLHDDGLPAGAFGCWRADISETWRADLGRSYTPEEERAHRERIVAMRRARDQEEARAQAKAAAAAKSLWESAKPAPEDHPYLKRKGIKPYGAKVAPDGRLLIPMRDSGGRLWNVERILPEKPEDGSTDKKALFGGKKIGLYYSLGSIRNPAIICIAEGFATGASIHEATEYPLAVAFNAGNLPAVARAIKDKFPMARIIVCADDDHLDPRNPGKNKALEAAQAVGGVLAIPDFGLGPEERPGDAKDFNDLHRMQGLVAVRRTLEGIGAEQGRAIPDMNLHTVTSIQAARARKELEKKIEVSDD